MSTQGGTQQVRRDLFVGYRKADELSDSDGVFGQDSSEWCLRICDPSARAVDVKRVAEREVKSSKTEVKLHESEAARPPRAAIVTSCRLKKSESHDLPPFLHSVFRGTTYTYLSSSFSNPVPEHLLEPHHVSSHFGKIRAVETACSV